jgi:hypothetical protein
MSDESDEILKLVEQVGPTIAVLADVDTSKHTSFLPGVLRALQRWKLDIVFHARRGSRSQMVSGNPDRLLYKMLKHVEGLHDQLNDIIDSGDTGENDVLLNVGAKLETELAELATGAMSIYDMQHTLSCFKLAISRAVSGATRPHGALPQGDRYPGLHSLVVNLQKIAQSSGGNFTAHRKLGAKGSIVEAIDEIRKHCDELGAYYLPGQDEHPAATYERLLHHARSHGKGRQPAG